MSLKYIRTSKANKLSFLKKKKNLLIGIVKLSGRRGSREPEAASASVFVLLY